MKLHLPKMLLSAVFAVVTGTSMAVADQMSKPAFGGTEWTYSTEDGLFHNGESTIDAPVRDSKGPVLVFDNVGTVTANAGADTSDAGGIKVTGNSVVTSNLYSYAGSIEVGEGAVLNASYYGWLKNTEAAGVANVWVDGTLTFTGRSNISIADGNNFQNWHIGTDGLINFGCADFVTDGRTLNLEVIVDTIGGVDGLVNRTKTMGTRSRTIATLTEGGNIFETLKSNCTIYDTSGTALTDATLVNNGTSVTVSYTGMGYDAQTLYTNEDVLWRANGTAENTLFSGTSFVNGDSVWVAGGSVTAQTDVTANVLTLYGGDLIVNGQRVSASTLSLSGTSKLDLSAAGSFLNVSTVTLDSDTVLELKGNWNLGTLTTDAKTFTKTGDGTLTLTNTGNFNGGTVNISEGTLEVSIANGGNPGVLQNTTVNVTAGGTFKSSGHDALGYGGGHTAKIVLTGAAGQEATFLNADTGSNTLVTDIVMNGYARVTGSTINTYGGTITASGTGNVIDSVLQIRRDVTMSVNEGGELTLSGTLSNGKDTTGSITVKGGGVVAVSGTGNTFSGNWSVNNAELVLTDGASVGSGTISLGEGGVLGIRGNVTLNNAVVGSSFDSDIEVYDASTLTVQSSLSLKSTWEITGNLTMGYGGSLSYDSLALLNDGDVEYSDDISGADNVGYASGNFMVLAASPSSTVRNFYSATIAGEYCSVTAEGDMYWASYDAGQKGEYFIRVDSPTIVYGDKDADGNALNAAASDATTGIVLDYGTMVMKENLNSHATQGITLLYGENTISLDDEVTLQRSSLSFYNDASLVLDGSGTFDLGSSPTVTDKKVVLGVTMKDTWTGTVALSNLTIGGMGSNTNALITSLNDLGNANSWVQISGVSGYACGEDNTISPTVTANLILADGDALTLNNGSSGSTTTFSGKVKGAGDIDFAWNGGNANTTVAFTGDVSSWNGKFKVTSAASERTVSFSGDATSISASVENSSAQKLNLKVANDAAVSFGGSVKNLGEGSLSVISSGSGLKTFSGDITASELKAENGTTLIAGSINVIDSVVVSGDCTLSVAEHSNNTFIQVDLASGATLDLSAGSSLGGSLTMQDGSVLIMTVGGPMALNGTLDLGSNLTLNLYLNGVDLPPDVYEYTLATGVTSITGADWTEVDASQYFSSISLGGHSLETGDALLRYDSEAKTLTLASAMVPEPTSVTLSLLALGALALRRRRD